jgi:hypothetical protein
MTRGLMFALFGFLGFAAGVGAATFFPFLKPFLAYLPAIFASEWFLSGVVGALFAVVMVFAFTSARH